MVELICPGTNTSSFDDWMISSNGTSSSIIPNIQECVQHSILTYIPALFLFLTSPVLLQGLHKSENARIENCSPITLKIVLCVILCVNTGLLLFHRLYDHIMSESLNTGVYELIYVGSLYASLALALVLLVACRNRGLVTSGILFLYWCLLAVCGLPEFRYKLDIARGNEVMEDPTEFYLFMVYYPLVLFQLLISCFADVPRYRVHDPRECPELRTSFLNQITFHWFTGLAITGDSSFKLVPEFTKNWLNNYKSFHAKNDKKKIGDQEMLVEPTKQANDNEDHPSVLYPLFQTYKWIFLSSAFFKLIFDLMQFISPQLLSLLIKFIEDKSQPLWVGIGLSLLMFVCALVQSLILHQYFHNMFRLGMNIRSVLTSAVYAKALNLSNNARKNRTVGEIVNLMSVDIQRFQDMTNFVMLFWSAPLQVILSIVFLTQLLGVAVIAGLVVLIAMVPVNSYISVKIRNCQVEQMKYKDERLKMMSEVLNGMKVLKFYAWEQSMQKMILNIRKKEIAVLKKLAFLNALTSLTWTCAPFLVAVLTFGVYVTIDPQNNVLTPQITFVALSLFNILRFPLAILAMIISQAIQCSVSNKRLKSFLDEEEMDINAVERSHTSGDIITVKDGSFMWDLSRDTPFALADINISIPSGSLVAVVGSVGSGKSSLLNAFLGEMNKLRGTVCVNGSIAYVPQQAWIQNLSLKSNILFNHSYDPDKYARALSVCELRPDLQTLPAGDLTEIGEKGINLSGGQKQRVSLARAVYAESDIYLLDDPLSAVDAHVGKHLFQNVISSTTGILKGKTRVLVTHGLNYLKKCDKIIVMKDGRISETGTYDELMASEGAFSEFLEEYLIEEAKNRGRSVSYGDQEEEVSEVLAELERLDPARKRRVESQISQVVYSSNESLEKVESPTQKSAGSDLVGNGVTSNSRRTRSESTRSQPKDTDTLLPPEPEKSAPEKSKLIEKETVETGKVKWFVYTTYIQAIGYAISTSFILIYAVSSVLGVLSNLWLAHWSDDAKTIQSDETRSSETNSRLAIYTGLGMGQAIFVTVASVTMALGMLRASRTLHEGILINVLRSPMSFFDVTPIGRILNRFGKDLQVIDVQLCECVNEVLYSVSDVCATVGIVLVVTFSASWVILPLMSIYFLVLDIDVMDSRIPQVVVTLVGTVVGALAIVAIPVIVTPDVGLVFAPIAVFYYFLLDVDGLDTALPRSLTSFIRTALSSLEIIMVICWATPMFGFAILPLLIIYMAVLRFYVSTSRQLKRLESTTRSPVYSHFQETIQGVVSIRAYKCMDRFISESQKKVDENLVTYYPSIVANRWLAVRLELVGNLIVLCSALFAALFRDSTGITAGLVGLSVSYALNITQTLNWAVRMTSELETNIVAVERIKEYSDSPTEAAVESSSEEKPLENWPSVGAISIENLKIRYREGLDQVLKGISLNINGKEKIGIVGRTGAGKSSLTLALFRIVEADEGRIVIDGVDISKIGLFDLRSRLTIVPQDPVLFSGTLRMNLDPFEEYSDADLWRALKLAHLESFVDSLSDRLEHKISEGGENLSVGQRQLVCLARAVLHKTRILVLDEAAAAVDMETDSLIQKTIREQFSECTVLTIAHRLNTVIDNDRLLVLERGEIREFDTPKALLEDTSSYFYLMAKDAGLV
ncbi:hypothetical protein QR680_002116 [Steinernema hermaphroditum]|uniref:ABC-type glutathione-S-conjugate transporter n=1 Tax=Steinernema hermaphroditum TaxID=289476 RepID=A0AA39H1B2_9BILA|nr:hypothetical protein QR680_002116 [Steinernema hermaphroditum]